MDNGGQQMAPMHCVEKAVENETQWMQHSATENVECSGWQVGLEVGQLQTTTFENLRNNRNIVCDHVTNYF